MKNGLVIGNSHVSMMAKSWGINRDDFPGIDLTFFAQAGNGPKGIEFDDTIMRATDPELKRVLTLTGGPHEVDLTSFDFLVIVACGLSIYPVIQALKMYRIWGWPHDMNPDDHLISAECFRTTLHDAFCETLGAKFAKTLRAKTDVPIYVVAQPMPSENLSTKFDKGHGFRRIETIGSTKQVLKSYQNAMRLVFASSSNTTVIEQPSKTITREIYTKVKYITGAVRLHDLDKRQSKQDTLHANHLYGTLVLERLSALVLNT